MSAQALAKRLATELADGADPAVLGAALESAGEAYTRLQAVVTGDDLQTLIRAVGVEAVLTVLNVLADADEWALVGSDGSPLESVHEAFLERIDHGPA